MDSVTEWYGVSEQRGMRTDATNVLEQQFRVSESRASSLINVSFYRFDDVDIWLVEAKLCVPTEYKAAR